MSTEPAWGNTAHNSICWEILHPNVTTDLGCLVIATNADLFPRHEMDWSVRSAFRTADWARGVARLYKDHTYWNKCGWPTDSQRTHHTHTQRVWVSPYTGVSSDLTTSCRVVHLPRPSDSNCLSFIYGYTWLPALTACINHGPAFSSIEHFRRGHAARFSPPWPLSSLLTLMFHVM